MRRSSLISSTSIVSILVLVMSASCGHTKATLDAKEASLLNPPADDGSDGQVEPGQTCSTADPNLPNFACGSVASQQFDDKSMQAYCVPDDVKKEVDSILLSMGPAHKAGQMIGVPVSANYRDIERSPDIDVPGVGRVRGYRYRDAGRGVNLDAGQDNRNDDKKNYATAFPSPSLRAASWDPELERRIGSAIGDETAASDNNMNLGPCMNIVRHPYWGRTQETYGEDAYAIGRMAAAYTVGVQEYVVGCAKHYAANNVEKNRSKQNAIMTEQVLREVYGRHFEMVVQDGAIGCIMASYNKINGIKATQNEHLLRDILKGPVSAGGMGFAGLVITDWWAMPGDQEVRDAATALSETIEAVKAGTDIEVPWQLHYSETTLAAADQALVEDAARRVLTQKVLFKSAMEGDPWSKKDPKSKLSATGSLEANEDHEQLAEDAVVESAVLLDNGEAAAPVLPLTDATKKLAVVGLVQNFKQISSSLPPTCGLSEDIPQGVEVAPRECYFNHGKDVALGDRGSSRVNADPARSVGPLAGITEAAAEFGITVTNGKAAEEVGDADTVVVVVGYTPGDEGEEYYIQAGGDRSSLNLPEGQNDLVDSVLALNKRTIIIIQSGAIVNLPWLTHANQNQATFWSGYPGMRGGAAYGRLIFGKDNFGGKMPYAWVKDKMLFPFKDTDNETTMGYFFGYRLWDKKKYIDQQSVDLVFPYGHGLSYSTFAYNNLTVPCETVTKDAVFEVTADISNTAGPAGDEVAFLFIKPPAKPTGITGERPWKELKSFARVTIPAGGTVTARLPVRVQDLRRWEGEANGKYVIDSGVYTIVVAKDAEAAESSTALVGTVTVNGD